MVEPTPEWGEIFRRLLLSVDENIGSLAINAALSFFIAWAARQTSKNIKRLEENTNSKMDLVVETVRDAATAKGNLEGREDLLDEQKQDRGEGAK